MSDVAGQLLAAAKSLVRDLQPLRFAEPVTHVYNPLEYAAAPHEMYVRRYGATSKEVLFLGMNPGPYGMTQTGVPFGEIAAVRDWLGIESPVTKPEHEHPKRPVVGFACPQSEVSGRRLWGLFASRFGSAEKFFAQHFVANFCPLVFMEASGKNRTPDKLPVNEAAAVLAACLEHLRRVIDALQPKWVIGVGAYAEAQATLLQSDFPEVRIARVLHPSPASPAANKDWAGNATRTMEKLGIW